MLLLVLDVGLHILYKSFGEFGEVIDIVQRVENAVDESLGEFTHGSHLLLLNELFLGALHFGRTLLNNLLKHDLITLQGAHTPNGYAIDQKTCQNKIEQIHVPPEVERGEDLEVDGDNLRFTTEGIATLHIEGVGA